MTAVGSKPGQAANTQGGDYADPGYQKDRLKRYPLDTADHVRAAASYFGMPKNRLRYTVAQRQSIDARISAAKKKLGIGDTDTETPAESGPRDERDAARRFIANRKPT